jgi:hypothetical protein
MEDDHCPSHQLCDKITYSFFYVPEVPDEKLRKEEARRRRKIWTYFEEISENLRKPRRFL